MIDPQLPAAAPPPLTDPAAPGPAAGPWWREVSAAQWRTLLAAGAGWALDACDVMLYAFALTAIREDLGLSAAAAGGLASVTLFAAALGGVVVGVLADRFGRVRLLAISILLYSVGTALCATANSAWELAIWRGVVGLGLAGEWATGSVLVAETWPPAHRGKGIGLMQSGWALGTLLAAVLAALVLPTWGWRPLFVLGVLPSLLVVWLRRRVEEPELWRRTRSATQGAAPEPGSAPPEPSSRAGRSAAERDHLLVLLAPPYLGRLVIATALATGLLWGYWGVFSWIPTYLAASGEGGAGLGLTRSLLWIVPMQLGAFAGYVSFGLLADRFGRRPTFLVFVLGAAVLAPLYAVVGNQPGLLLAASPLLGYLGHGYWSVLGALLAELFPSAVRAGAQGFCYNAGRAVAAAAPWAVGALAGAFGFVPALAFAAAGFLVAGGLMMLLPETRGAELA